MNRFMRKNALRRAVIFGAVFVLLTVLLKLVDVRPIGPQDTEVGFAALNGAFHKLTGVHEGLYKLTEWLGYLAILVAVFFAALGVMQLVRRRSFDAVDIDLYILAVLYAAAIILYLFFELVIINYRPVILEGDPEASFPSSHTMVSLVILGSAVYEFGIRIRKKQLRNILQYACMGLAAVIVLGRLFSGVHWFTDIVGGLLLGMSLILFYVYAMTKIRKKTAKTEKPERER